MPDPKARAQSEPVRPQARGEVDVGLVVLKLRDDNPPTPLEPSVALRS